MKKLSQNRTKLFALAGAAALLSTASSAAQAQMPKTDGSVAALLAAKTAHGSCAVIARLDGDLPPARQAQLAALGADVTRHLGFIHSVALSLPERNLAKLAALPFVTHLSYDGKVKKSDAFTDASSGAAYARQNYNLTGKGVTVGVVDSGSSYYQWDLVAPDGTKRVIASPDFTQGQQTIQLVDVCGHGTHVAGIIGGNGIASTGPLCTQTYYGIAPQADIASVRVLDQNGASSVSVVLAGLQWVIANKTAYNIRVVNLSLGHPVGESYTTDPLCQAVEAAWKAGIVVVCAAGNNGRLSAVSTPGAGNEGWGTAYGSIQSPGNDPYVITVGATKNMDGSRADDKIATYSSRGPSRLDLILKPDIVAPGNKIISLDVDWSTLSLAYASTDMVPYSAYTTAAASGASGSLGASNCSGAGYSNAYFVLSGTSMAAPVVSGAAALMLQANPSLTPDTIKARLMASADKWEAPIGTYEAESSVNTLAGKAYVYSNSYFSGGAVVHALGLGGTLQFNKVTVPSAGAYTLTVSYVNGDTAARTALVSVNGASPMTVSFPPLGTWSHYQTATVQVPLTLSSGANTIKFSNPNAFAPDIDRIALTQSDPLTYGAGYLDIPAALASTVTPTQSALSPQLTLSNAGTITINTNVIGSTNIWGSKAITGVSTVYGSKAITGVSTVSSSKTICGSSVWGDKTVCVSSSPAVDLSSVAAYGE